MSWPTLEMTLRLRVLSTVSGALGLIAVLLAVGALFPSVGHTIGTLNIPKGVSNLLGGADYATLTGWYTSEIGSVYGPLVIAWLKYLSVFYYYAGHDPLANGVDIGGLIVLGAVAVLLTALGMVGIERRDLRA